MPNGRGSPLHLVSLNGRGITSLFGWAKWGKDLLPIQLTEWKGAISLHSTNRMEDEFLGSSLFEWKRSLSIWLNQMGEEHLSSRLT